MYDTMLKCLCPFREQDSVLVHRLASTHLPPVPPANPAVSPPQPSTFTMNLCQRTQGCMKAENHTGFCSGHRGFKRKNTGPYGGGDEFGQPRRRKPTPGSAKGRAGPAAARDAAVAASGGASMSMPPVDIRMYACIHAHTGCM